MDYYVTLPDQDALNAIICKSGTLILPFQYNILVDAYINILEVKENRIMTFDYSQEQIKFALNNPIIFHFVNGFKPWNPIHLFLDKGDKPLVLYWWQVAWNTPFFSDELKTLFATKRDNYLVCKDFGLYVASLINECSKGFVGYVKMPFIVYKAFSEFDLNRNYAKDFSESLDKNVAFELISVATRAWGKKSKCERIAKFAILPFRIYRTKNRCKKGIYKAQKGNVISRLYV